MACTAARLLSGALLHHLAASAAGAFSAAREVSESRSAEAIHVQRADSTAELAFHARARKAAGAVGLRRASAFRASRAGASRRASLRGGSRQVPAYVQKIGLANVTEPTALPPPPPVLHPWEDKQPLDTAVGNYIISGFVAQPTLTPPPTQASLDLAFACPVLLTWPSEVGVSVPDECGSRSNGNWTNMRDKSLLLNWETSCVDSSTPGIHMPQFTPVTTYTMENGDLFGTSQQQSLDLFSNNIVLRDCGGAVVYVVEEKLYKQVGKPIDEVCEKYHSCDGVVYLQYFIKNSQGKTVALTPHLTLFQDSFSITDPSGVAIATVTRNGWDPPIKTDCSEDKQKLWTLKFARSPPGMWAAATNQWPIAEMMTMLAHRDELRQPNGQVIWSNCEVLKTTGMMGSIVAFAFCLICVPLLCFIFCSGMCGTFFQSMERTCFPKRMSKPMKYGN